MRQFLFLPIPLLALTSLIFLNEPPSFEISNNKGFGKDHHRKESLVFNDAIAFPEFHVATLGIPVSCNPATSVTVSPNPLCPGDSAVFTAFGIIPGAMVAWFDAVTGGIEVATGNPITSPPLFTTTTYCVEQSYLITHDTLFEYTGDVQTFTVPAGVTSVDIQAIGANGSDQFSNIGTGGKGGMANGILPVVPGQILQVYVGGNGNIITGGFNGGGNGGTAPGIINVLQHGGGGGGASDVRIGAGTLLDRVIVAGGGGGFGSKGGAGPNFGGGGGGLTGGSGSAFGGSGGFGSGGTQLAGGNPGIGSLGSDGYPGQWSIGGDGGTTSNMQPCGGGGGGGYFGGGGGAAYLSSGGGGGGGGSSYIGGVIGGTTQGSGTNTVVTGGEVMISYMTPCVSDRICSTVMVDNIPPSITCPQDITVQCSNNYPPPDLLSLTGSDNSGIPPIFSFVKDSVVNQICIDQFRMIRTYMAIDGCGNSATCMQNITFIDTIAPTIICPPDVTIPCSTQVPAVDISLVNSSDNCGSALNITFISDVITNQICDNQFIISRTYESTDACENAVACTQVITVDDQVPPTISCPLDITVSCAALVPVVDIESVISSDNCGSTPNITFISDVITNQICDNQYVITRTYQSTDACENSATCTQVITIDDQVSPTISCPPDITVSCATLVPVVNIESVISSDNCSTTPAITFVSDSISDQNCTSGFIITRTYRSTDACGNATTCSQIITVMDNIAPVILFTDPQIVNLTNGGTLQIQCFGQDSECGIVGWNENSIMASDNCDLTVTVEFSYALIDEGDCLNEAYTNKYLLTWVATDACGNNSTANIFLEVLDLDISCLEDIYIPNIFSPNGDGINDVFGPFIKGLFSSYYLMIFDRWGNFVYESSTYGETWNGSFNNKACSPGVYVYALSFILGDGEEKLYVGDITLIR